MKITSISILLSVFTAIILSGCSGGSSSSSGGGSTNNPPVVTLIGSSTISILEGSTYIDEGATAIDVEDGNLIPVKSGTVETTTLGTYIITWTATDSAGDTGTAKRTVKVIDGVAPIVTLIGDTNVTQSFGNYVEKGATAEDNIDGNLTEFIKVNPKLNSKSEAGTYTVTYIAIDTAGNKGTAIRSVTINPCENYNPITAGCEDLPL